MYERLPFLRTEWSGTGPNYNAFSHVISNAKKMSLIRQQILSN